MISMYVCCMGTYGCISYFSGKLLEKEKNLQTPKELANLLDASQIHLSRFLRFPPLLNCAANILMACSVRTWSAVASRDIGGYIEKNFSHGAMCAVYIHRYAPDRYLYFYYVRHKLVHVYGTWELFCMYTLDCQIIYGGSVCL